MNGAKIKLRRLTEELGVDDWDWASPCCRLARLSGQKRWGGRLCGLVFLGLLPSGRLASSIGCRILRLALMNLWNMGHYDLQWRRNPTPRVVDWPVVDLQKGKIGLGCNLSLFIFCRVWMLKAKPKTEYRQESFLMASDKNWPQCAGRAMISWPAWLVLEEHLFCFSSYHRSHHHPPDLMDWVDPWGYSSLLEIRLKIQCPHLIVLIRQNQRWTHSEESYCWEGSWLGCQFETAVCCHG